MKLLIVGIVLIATGVWLIKRSSSTTTLFGIVLIVLGLVPFIGVLLAVISFVFQLIFVAVCLTVVALVGVFWLKNRKAHESVQSN